MNRSRSISQASVVLAMLVSLSSAGCSIATGGSDEDFESNEEALNAAGHLLFDKETFDGNGRTCRTCHSKQNGTLTLEQIATLNAECEPDSTSSNCAIFKHDGLDADGVGRTRILAHGTITVEVKLPPFVKLADDPTATSVRLNRSIPTTRNTPALDPILMWDARNTTFTPTPQGIVATPHLDQQAAGAIEGHAQPAREPTQAELDAIADFQKTDKRFFSSDALEDFANGAPPPALPAGNTPSEQRGRTFFIDAPVTPNSKVGMCAVCHSGPMLNRTNFFGFQAGGLPPGLRTARIGVDSRNEVFDPVRQWIINDGFGPPLVVSSPDIGLTLSAPPFAPPRFLVGFFKIPTLWGVKDTAPYFHNNGRKTLRDAVEFYVAFFPTDPVFKVFPPLDAQDVDDMTAFLMLL